MINRYLSGYDNFKCAASECPDTCCGPWEIEVDDVSWDRYKKLYNEGNELIKKYLDIDNNTFLQREDGRCTFLRKDGLCQMILDLGEDSICRTCDMYPRHIEEFPGVREHSISLSCPVAAVDFLKDENRQIMTESTDTTVDDGEYEEFDEELYDILVRTRKNIIDFLQDRETDSQQTDEKKSKKTEAGKINIRDKFEAVLDFVYNIQDALDDEDYEWIEDALVNQIPLSESDDEHRYYSELRAVYNIFFDMDILNPDFAEFQKNAFDGILSKGEEFFLKVEAEFEQANPKWALYVEKVATYFIYTYFCGAIYDGYVYAQGAQAIFNALVIKVGWIYVWLSEKEKSGSKSMDIEKMAEVLYRHSRELENCVGNQIFFEKSLDEMV